MIVGDGGGHLRRGAVVEQDRRAILGEGRGITCEIVDRRRRVVNEAEVQRRVDIVAGERCDSKDIRCAVAVVRHEADIGALERDDAPIRRNRRVGAPPTGVASLPASSTDTRLVVCVMVSWTNTSRTPFVSFATRLLASLSKVT